MVQHNFKTLDGTDFLLIYIT